MAAKFISSEIYRATGYEGNHPLAIERIGAVMTLAEQLGWLEKEGPNAYTPSPVASEDQLLAFHTADYLAALKAADARGRAIAEEREKYALGTLENPVFRGVFERASTSVGGSILAARSALADGLAYHAPGGTHHGMPDRANGFCFMNDPVFAILTFLQAGLTRIAYVDLDAHHGDGVEAAFSGDDRVFLISMHEENRWPFTGTLADRAAGNARNLAVPREMNDTEFAYLIDEAVLPLLAQFNPEAIVMVCGADPLLGDPLSSLALSNGALADATMTIAQMAPATAILGGGGYNPWTLSRYWTTLWGRILGKPMPAALPPQSTAYLETLSSDLVDDEDEMEPFWTKTLIDPPNRGMLRPRFAEIAQTVLRP